MATTDKNSYREDSYREDSYREDSYREDFFPHHHINSIAGTISRQHVAECCMHLQAPTACLLHLQIPTGTVGKQWGSGGAGGKQ